MSRPPRVLVTRAAHQASALAEALRARGAEPVLVPTIEIAPLEDYAELDRATARIASFDWLVFTSANAVEVFAQRLGSGAGERLPRIAAIGSATLQALHSCGLTADLVAPEAVGESLAGALKQFARREDGSPAQFLLVRAEQARDVLPDTLREAGGAVTIVPAYRTVLPVSSIAQVQQVVGRSELLPDAVTFTSSSSVRNLLELLSVAKIELPRSVLRVSIGPITSATLREAGFPADVEAEHATVASLAEAVMAGVLQRRKLSGE